MAAESTARRASAPHVELRGLRKEFGATTAVAGVDLAIARGSIHAIVGENGAGKSTLGRVVAGVLAPSGGSILVDGKQVQFSSPRDALARGIAMIDQELALAPAMTVAENVVLGSEPARFGLTSRRRDREHFRRLVEESGFDLDPNATVGALRVADQQKVEILRAMSREAKLIVMDEPTARLTDVESRQLMEMIRVVRGRGTTIIYVSHFLKEVLGLADEVTIMRDGQVVRTSPVSVETEETLVQGMLGRSLDRAFPELPVAPDGAPVVVETRDLSRRGVFEGISLEVRAGEIVGLAGLVGSGRTDVGMALFGATRPDSGQILLEGAAVRLRSPSDAIRRGIFLLPESRKDEGLVMKRSVAENAVLPHLRDVSTFGVLSNRREAAVVEAMIGNLGIRCASRKASMSTLSGGNQQKVAIGKWLVRTPKLLIADEPTRGVDVGSKRAIYELLVDLAAQGVAILLISSELEEVIEMSHRVGVMHRGRLMRVIDRADVNEEAVLSAAFGGTAAA